MDYNQFINLEYFFYKIYQFFGWIWDVIAGLFFGGSGSKPSGGFWAWIVAHADLFRTLLELLVIAFLAGIIYCLIRIYEINKEENDRLNQAPIAIDEEPYDNKQWDIVLEHSRSENPSDWRTAIIEADNMLEAMMKKIGYEGEDLGERLKAVEPSDFETLESAWEAHKVRNKIVHDGVGFELTKTDTEWVIKLYEKVFREFNFI